LGCKYINNNDFLPGIGKISWTTKEIQGWYSLFLLLLLLLLLLFFILRLIIYINLIITNTDNIQVVLREIIKIGKDHDIKSTSKKGIIYLIFDFLFVFLNY